MTKLTPKQIAKWIQTLPAATEIFCNDEWSDQQRNAVFAKVTADRAAYEALYQALEAADFNLACYSVDCANENIAAGWTDSQLCFWSEMRNYLASAAGQVWENAGRNVNTETGLAVY